MLPIHTGGARRGLSGASSFEWITLVYYWSTVFFPFSFFLLYRASPGPNSLREARVIIVLLFLTSQSSEQRTSFFFFSFHSYVVQCYCIKNHLISPRYSWHARRARRSFSQFRNEEKKKSRGEDEEKIEKEERVRDAPTLCEPFSNLAAIRAPPRGWRDFRITWNRFPLYPFPRWLFFFLFFFFFVREATYYFKWHCSYNIDRLPWKKFHQFLPFSFFTLRARTWRRQRNDDYSTRMTHVG